MFDQLEQSSIQHIVYVVELLYDTSILMPCRAGFTVTAQNPMCVLFFIFFYSCVKTEFIRVEGKVRKIAE